MTKRLTIDASDDDLEKGIVAARAMLAALEWIKERAAVVDSEIVDKCEAEIAQAEAAGITTE